MDDERDLKEENKRLIKTIKRNIFLDYIISCILKCNLVIGGFILHREISSKDGDLIFPIFIISVCFLNDLFVNSAIVNKNSHLEFCEGFGKFIEKVEQLKDK